MESSILVLSDLIEKKSILSSVSIDLYFSLLSQVIDYRKSQKILILPSSFLSNLFRKEFDCSSLLLDQDVFLFETVLMPFKSDQKWFLLVLENSFDRSKLIYYDVSLPDYLPSFVHALKAYFIFDFFERRKGLDVKSKIIYTIKIKKGNQIFPFSDLFSCLIARSYVLKKDPSFFFNYPSILLRDLVLFDFETFKKGGVKALSESLFELK